MVKLEWIACVQYVSPKMCFPDTRQMHFRYHSIVLVWRKQMQWLGAGCYYQLNQTWALLTNAALQGKCSAMLLAVLFSTDYWAVLYHTWLCYNTYCSVISHTWLCFAIPGSALPYLIVICRTEQCSIKLSSTTVPCWATETKPNIPN